MDFNLFQVVAQPTRGNNILDLILTNAPETIDQIVSFDGLSDHSLLQVTLNVPSSFTGFATKKICDYNK